MFLSSLIFAMFVVYGGVAIIAGVKHATNGSKKTIPEQDINLDIQLPEGCHYKCTYYPTVTTNPYVIYFTYPSGCPSADTAQNLEDITQTAKSYAQNVITEIENNKRMYPPHHFYTKPKPTTNIDIPKK